MRFGARADGDVARRRDEEGPVRTALVLEQGAEPRESCRDRVGVDGCREVAPDHEVRAFAATDLVGDDGAHDGGIFLVRHIEAGIRQRHRL